MLITIEGIDGSGKSTLVQALSESLQDLDPVFTREPGATWVGESVRRAIRERMHSLIKKQKEFVVNFIPYSLVKTAQFCGTHSGKSTNKLSKTRLTLAPSKKVSTPLIKEGYAHLECKLVKSVSFGNHTLFVGEVIAVSADRGAFKNDLLRTDKIHPLYYIGENTYTTLDRIKRKTF